MAAAGAEQFFYGTEHIGSPRGPSTPVVQELQRRLQQAEVELAAVRLERSQPHLQMSEAIGKAIGEAMRAGPSGRESTIKVQPKIEWPTLSDEDNTGYAIQDFYENLERIFSIANDGRGMSYKERLTCLETCLKGSRRKTYRNVLKSLKEDGTVESDPKMIYLEVKDRLMRFSETAVEKQLRFKSQYESLKRPAT